ncbi:MAG: DNA repair protein RecO [Gammaproteobacteria bacterium]|nr:DNA repair protein RecO [Gammaproteobacteria bacterium]
MSNKSLVIKRIDFEETSLIINVLGENGVTPLMIKGAKRKNSNKLSISEPLTLIEYEATKAKFPSLTEGVVIDNFDSIKNDLFRLSIANVIIEYAYQLKDAELDFKYLFNLVLMSLDEIKEISDPEESLFRFQIFLTKLLGITIRKSYLIENYNASISLLNNLDLLFKGEKLNEKSEIRNFFIEYFKNEMGLNLKSVVFYLSLCKE